MCRLDIPARPVAMRAGGRLQVLRVWWEDGFEPRLADGRSSGSCYRELSALALAVEAVEAFCTFLSDCDPGLTAAVRPFERSAM